MQIPFSALDKQHVAILPELLAAVETVFHSGNFILGPDVEEFEKKFAQYHNMKYAIGVNSGTDAILLSLRALDIGPGDEVITSVNTFITTVSSIALVGAKPVLVDIGHDDNIDVDQIEQHITKKTKAILPVHWTGRACDMSRVCAIAKKYNLKIIEDGAQAVSAKHQHQLVGTFGDAGCFSLHPFKTLNASGDAGVIITNDETLAEKLRALRQNGLSNGLCHYWSNNSRLDAMQAAILNVKFKYFEEWTKRRIEIARYYIEKLQNIAEITLPKLVDKNCYAVFHTFIIKAKKRNALKEHLQHNKIETRIHYQVPIHRQPIAIKTLRCRPTDFPNMENVSEQALSLPIYPELNSDQLDYIIKNIKDFYSGSNKMANKTNIDSIEAEKLT